MEIYRRIFKDVVGILKTSEMFRTKNKDEERERLRQMKDKEA